MNKALKTSSFWIIICFVVFLSSCGASSVPETAISDAEVSSVLTTASSEVETSFVPTITTSEIKDNVESISEAESSSMESNIPKGFQGSIKLIINTSAKDTKTDKKTMIQYKENKYTHKPFDMKIHLFPETTEESVTSVPVRILVEAQWCSEGVPIRDFLIQSDEIITISTNTWYLKEIHDSLATSNFFWRITVYDNDTERILVTKTVYTPYEESVLYSESSIKDDEPDFHPFQCLTEEEQEYYDIIAPAIQDYGKKYHYPVLVKCEGGAQKDNTMYCIAVFSVGKSANAKKTEVYFAINAQNPKEYKASTDYSRILISGPFDRSTDRTNMAFYLNLALTKSYNGN